MFLLDRSELLDATVAYLKGRFDPLLSSDVLTWMSDSFEHRRWPPKGSADLEDWGVDALTEFSSHYSNIQCMEGFNLEEALHQWGSMKRRLRDEPFFKLPYKQFYEHVCTTTLLLISVKCSSRSAYLF